MKKDKFDIFLEGETVNLVILNDFIAKNSDWYSWLNYKKNTELLQQGRFPNSKEKQLEYFKTQIVKKKDLNKKKLPENQKIQLGIVVKENNKLIGMVTLLDFDYFNRCCGISLIMDLRKKISNRLKVFKESQDLIINHAFFKMNLRRIYTIAFSDNLCKMTERVFGFKREGVLREHQFSNGKYVDSYVLGLLRSDWKKNED